MADAIKKVAPFPIETSLIGSFGTLAGKIMKLNAIGVMVECESVIKVGVPVSFKFILPVLGNEINAQGVAVKIYTSYIDEPGKAKKGQHLIEIHFKSIEDVQRVAIDRFLKAIKAK